MFPLVLLNAPSVDGEEIVFAARVYMRKAGYSQRFALEHLRPPERKTPDTWLVGLAHGKRIAWVTVDKAGKVTRMFSPGPMEADAGQTTNPTLLRSGEEAVALTRRTLSEFGYRNPARLHLLAPAPNDTPPSLRAWRVELKPTTGDIIYAYVHASSPHITFLKVPSPTNRNAPVTTDRSAQLAQATKFVDQLRGAQPVLLHSLVCDDIGVVKASYQAVIEGHTFFTPWHAGYSISFDGRTNELREFAALREVPPIDPRPAVFDLPKAEEEFRRIVARDILPSFESTGRFKIEKVDYSPARFGYLLRRSESVARRAWVQTVTIHTDPTLRLRDRQFTIMFDAVTGDRIPQFD